MLFYSLKSYISNNIYISELESKSYNHCVACELCLISLYSIIGLSKNI
jgi:hypothetical protein